MSAKKYQYKKFTREDYKEYSNWFQDPDLKKSLGGIDEEWLNFILEDEQGIEYAVFLDNELICVIGITLPSQNNDYLVISNLAVHPDHRRKGIGSEVLGNLLFKLKPKENWVSFVASENQKAADFFKKNGWAKRETDQDGMIRFEFSNKK